MTDSDSWMGSGTYSAPAIPQHPAAIDIRPAMSALGALPSLATLTARWRVLWLKF
ncbi:hypothetical protein [Actimicrobium antarcticum]|uniref:hypothetical protein n=1 Tax=Actimicrobium antarcticum TaxID=1051899 RepID=UPI0031DAC0BD